MPELSKTQRFITRNDKRYSFPAKFNPTKKKRLHIAPIAMLGPQNIANVALFNKQNVASLSEGFTNYFKKLNWNFPI